MSAGAQSFMGCTGAAEYSPHGPGVNAGASLSREAGAPYGWFLPQDPIDLRSHLVDVGHAIDRAQNPLCRVVRQDRNSLAMVRLEPRGYGLAVVVGAAG